MKAIHSVLGVNLLRSLVETGGRDLGKGRKWGRPGKRQEAARTMKSVPVGPGGTCPTCNVSTTRYEHGPGWRPEPGKTWAKFWDRCNQCRRFIHYREAVVQGRPRRTKRGHLDLRGLDSLPGTKSSPITVPWDGPMSSPDVPPWEPATEAASPPSSALDGG